MPACQAGDQGFESPRGRTQNLLRDTHRTRKKRGGAARTIYQFHLLGLTIDTCLARMCLAGTISLVVIIIAKQEFRTGKGGWMMQICYLKYRKGEIKKSHESYHEEE